MLRGFRELAMRSHWQSVMNLWAWREDSRMIRKKLKILRMKSRARGLLGASRGIFFCLSWVKSMELITIRRLLKKWILTDWRSKIDFESCLRWSSRMKTGRIKLLSNLDLVSSSEFSKDLQRPSRALLQQMTKLNLSLLILTFKCTKRNWTLTLMS